MLVVTPRANYTRAEQLTARASATNHNHHRPAAAAAAAAAETFEWPVNDHQRAAGS